MSTPDPTAKSRRLTLELPPKDNQDLEALKEKLHAHSYADALRRSVGFMNTVLDISYQLNPERKWVDMVIQDDKTEKSKTLAFII